MEILHSFQVPASEEAVHTRKSVDSLPELQGLSGRGQGQTAGIYVRQYRKIIRATVYGRSMSIF